MKLSRKLFEVLLLFFLSLTPLLWLRKGEVILGHDSGFRLDPVRHLVNLFYSWNPNYNFGTDWSFFKGFLITQAPEAFFTYLAGSLAQGQTLTFIFWFFVIGLSMYFFVNGFFSKKEYWFLRIFSSTFYMYNFFLLQAWFIVERSKFSLMAALPLGYLIMYKTLTKDYSLAKGTVLFAFLFFFLNGGGNSTMYGFIVVTYGLLFIYLILLDLKKNGLRQLVFAVKAFFSFLFAFIGPNAYWLSQQVYLYIHAYSSTIDSSGGIGGILAWEKAINRYASFINLFRLQAIPDWYRNLSHPYSAFFIENAFFIVLSFLPITVLAYGLFRYSVLKNNKENKKLIYSMVILFLVSVFFTAGSHPPLGFLYEIFIRYIPGFAMFRSAFYKFGGAFWFSFIFLFAYFLNTIILENIKKKALRITCSILFFCFILVYHFPYFQANFFTWNSPFTTRVKIPGYVFEMSKYINKTPPSRILLLPSLDPNFRGDSYKWGFFSYDAFSGLSTNHAIVADTIGSTPLITAIYEAISKNDENGFLRLMSAGQIDKILWRDDVLYLDKKTDSRNFLFLKKNLENFKDVISEKQVGPWVLYSLDFSHSHYTNLFSAPDMLTHAQSTSATIGSIFSKENGSLQPTLLFSESYIDKDFEILSYTNEYIVEAKCQACKIEDSINMPNVRLLPDSPFYFFLASREAKTLADNKNIPDQRLITDLVFANKRIAEISGVIQREKKDNSEVLINKIIERYEMSINDAVDTSSRLPENLLNSMLLRILNYLNSGYYSLRTMDNRHALAEKALEDLSLFIQKKTTELEKRVWMTKSSKDQIKYLFHVNQSGDYDLYISEASIKPEKIILDDKNVGNKTSVYIPEGLHKLNLIYSFSENHLDVYKTTSSGEFFLGFGERIQFGIKNYDDKDVYEIAFSYKTKSGKPSFSIVKENGDFKSEIKSKLETSDAWNMYRFTFKPESGDSNVRLEFFPVGFDYTGATIQLKDFEVKKVITPEVFLSRKVTSLPMLPPRVSFVEINPTKYTVHVENVKTPYLLVFKDQYAEGWKAYLVNEKLPINEQNHYQVNDFANGWFIKQTGTYDISVEYEPQSFFYIGIFISVASIIILSLSGFITFLRRKCE